MSKKRHTIYFLSLGCAKNRVDTEVMAGISLQKGYQIVADAKDADIILVNTCAFIEKAREESIATLLDMVATLAKRGKEGSLIAAGCLAQRYPAELAAEMPELAHILGTGQIHRFADLLDGTAQRIEVGKAGHFLQSTDTPRFIEPSSKSAYIKIADGCSRKCAFCSIPMIRGTTASSRSIEEIVEESRRLTEQGIKELNLVAQDTSTYGRERRDGTTLIELLRQLDSSSGATWIRLLYLYPDAVSDTLLRTIASLPRVVPYLDIPIQHVSANMLKTMRRGHTRERVKELIVRARELVPDAFLRTTVLVGHPGETDRDFQQLLEFIEWAKFNHLGVFRYSDEEGTAARSLKNKVSARVSYNRFRKVVALQRRIAKYKNKELIGKQVAVLAESYDDEQGYVIRGRHAGQAPSVDGVTFLVSCDASPGEMVNARVVDSGDYDLVAEPLDPDIDE